MKQFDIGFLKALKLFVKEHIAMALICVLFFLAYKDLTNQALILAFLTLAVLYATAITVCHYGMAKLLQYEKSGALTFKGTVKYSVLIGMPVYFLWFSFSLIPIPQYEVWLLVGAPLMLFTGLTLAPIADYWKGKRFLFWSIHVVIYVCFLVGGQLAVRSLL